MKLSRSLSILFVSAIALVSTGCTCRTTVAPEAGNVPPPVADGPLKDINFAFDSYKIDATAKGILAGNAEWLKANSGSKVQIEGHCDERGTNEYNMVLGANRARAAMEHLRTLGVDASRMSTVSYGEELPLDPAHNEAAWAKNRRDHFKVD
jgi:peptidoglycan-associated lipoprotein